MEAIISRGFQQRYRSNAPVDSGLPITIPGHTSEGIPRYVPANKLPHGIPGTNATRGESFFSVSVSSNQIADLEI